MPPVNFELVLYTPPAGNEVNFEFIPFVVVPPLIGFGIRGRIGKAGDPDLLGVNGIYQMRLTKRGKIPIKMKFWVQPKPKEPNQLTQQAKFKSAMAAWSALTTEQKAVYTKRAKKRGMFPWGLFIREYYKLN